MYVREKYNENMAKVEELEHALEDINRRIDELKEKKKPLEAEIKKLEKDFGYSDLLERLSSLPDEIEKLKNQHYLYFYINLLKLFQKMDDGKYPEVDLLGYLEELNIWYYAAPDYSIPEIIEMVEKNSNAIYYDPDDNEVMSHFTERREEDDELLQFDIEYTVEELDDILDNILTLFKMTKIYQLLIDATSEDDFHKSLMPFLRKNGIEFDPYLECDRLLYEGGTADYYEFDVEPIDMKSPLRIPKSADLDILYVKLDEEIHRLIDDWINDPNYREYLRLKEVYGSRRDPGGLGGRDIDDIDGVI